jgi:hypothetical protein
MAEKVLTYEEFTGSSERTPEKVAAYLEYLKAHESAKNNFLNKK